MLTRWLRTLCLIALTLTTISSAQETPVPNQPLQFMVGYWEVTSELNVALFSTGDVESNAEWQTTTGVSQIDSVIEDNALIEYYSNHLEDQRYEQTLFLGTANDGRSWITARTDSFRNQVVSQSGRFEDEIFTMADRERRTEIEAIDEDNFQTRLYLLQRDADPILIETRTYSRLSDADAYQENYDALLEAYPQVNEPPPQVADFHFWLGSWQIEHPSFEDVSSRVDLGSGGHALIEFWQVNNIENPPEFFTMTIWDIDAGSYFNWFWSKGGRTQVYTGGTCEGEGADKICRLAGEFFNITETAFDWRFGAQEWFLQRISD